MCDHSSVANGWTQANELAHPIVAAHSFGAYVIDVDGNKFIDVGMGRGSILFGHNSSFVRSAVQQMMDEGAWALGCE
jgi:glutamate-1-semialdehyde aminotransferase